MIGCDDGATHSLRLGGDATETLRINGRRYDDGGHRIGGRHIAAMIDDTDLAFEAAFSYGLLQFGAVFFTSLIGTDQYADRVRTS